MPVDLMPHYPQRDKGTWICIDIRPSFVVYGLNQRTARSIQPLDRGGANKYSVESLQLSGSTMNLPNGPPCGDKGWAKTLFDLIPQYLVLLRLTACPDVDIQRGGRLG